MNGKITLRRLALAISGLIAVSLATALAAPAAPASPKAAPLYTWIFHFGADAKIVNVSGTKYAVQVKAWGTSKQFSCNPSYWTCYRPVYIRIRIFHGLSGSWKFVAARSKTTGSYAAAGVTELFHLPPCDTLPEGLSIPFAVEAVGTAIVNGSARTYRKNLRYDSCA